MEHSKRISYRGMRTDIWMGKACAVVRYQIACDCGDSKHIQTMEIELDADSNMCFVRFWADLKWCDYWYDEDSWLRRWWLRLQAIWRILITGHIEVQGDFVIRGKEHLDVLAQAIQEGGEILKCEENDLT